jgi:type VI secretion system protein ImpA
LRIWDCGFIFFNPKSQIPNPKSMFSSEELQRPPVIDLEEFLRPISEENPVGESLRYSGLYDEILEARRADENLEMGQWKYELKTADFPKVIELAGSALKTRTKDLQLAVWFSEALTKEKGFAGLRDSLKLVSGLQEAFWENLFPEIDDGDQEGRANALSAFDKLTADAIREKPLTEGEGLSWINWDESTRFDIPDNLDAVEYNEQQRYKELRQQAEAENRVTGDRWRKARAATSRLFVEQTFYILGECWTEFENLNRVIEEKFDRNQAPGLNLLKKSLDDIQTQVKRLLDEKRMQEPDEADEPAGGDAATEGEVSEDGTGSRRRQRQARGYSKPAGRAQKAFGNRRLFSPQRAAFSGFVSGQPRGQMGKYAARILAAGRYKRRIHNYAGAADVGI